MATLYRRKGSPYWQARIWVNGVMHRVSTGCRNHREAQKKAEELEEEANRLIVKPQDLTLEQAAERFFQEKDLAPRTVRNYRSSLGSLKRKLGNFPLKALTVDELRHYVGVRRRETGDVAIRRDLAFLSSLYSQAQNWENGPRTNPVKALDKRGIKDAEQHTTWLTREQFERLLAACREEYQRAMLIVAVDTGLRHSELLGLTWDEVDLDAREIRLGNLDRRRTKNRSYRIIPMTERVYDTLCHHPRGTSPYVFPNPRTGERMTSMKGFFLRACKRADLPALRIHDLRHTFASWSLQSGMPEIVVQTLLGHKTRSMTRRYAHVSREQLHAEIGKLCDTLRDTKVTDFRGGGEHQGIGA